MTISKEQSSGSNICEPQGLHEHDFSHKKLESSANTIQYCELCIDNNGAVYRCRDCAKNICNYCKLYHTKVWKMMGHKICPLDEN